MSWGLRQPSTVAPKGVPGSVLDRAAGDLKNSPAFADWAQRWAQMGGDALASPSKFGIDYLPKDVWVNKQGQFVSTDAGFPWGPLIAVLGTGAAAGFGGAALAGRAATGGAAAAVHGIDSTIAGMGGDGISSAAGGGALAKLKDFFTSKNGIKDIAGLAALLPFLKNSGGGGTPGTGTAGLPLPTDNPFASLAVPAAPTYDPAVANSARDAYAMQKHRVEQTQPAMDALVAQAYGMTPTRYRGPAPEGVPATATAAPAGPYAYDGPRFS